MSRIIWNICSNITIGGVDKMTFGEKLRLLRKRNGYTQEELAASVGTTIRAIRYYEADERFPQTKVLLEKFAELFNVSADILSDDKEEILLTKEEQFIEKAKHSDKFKGKSEAQKYLERSKGLFAGGELSEDDKDALFESLTEIYFDAKKRAKEKFTAKSNSK